MQRNQQKNKLQPNKPVLLHYDQSMPNVQVPFLTFVRAQDQTMEVKKSVLVNNQKLNTLGGSGLRNFMSWNDNLYFWTYTPHIGVLVGPSNQGTSPVLKTRGRE